MVVGKKGTLPFQLEAADTEQTDSGSISVYAKRVPGVGHEVFLEVTDWEHATQSTVIVPPHVARQVAGQLVLAADYCVKADKE